MIGKNSLLKTIHLEDLKTSYQVTGSSLLNQCGTFCDLEIGYSILPNATSLKLSMLTKFESEYYNADTTTKHIFPILSKVKLIPTQVEHRKKIMLLQYNKQLKEISMACGINKPSSIMLFYLGLLIARSKKGVV